MRASDMPQGDAARDVLSAQQGIADLVPVLDRLCPMHLVVAQDGTLVHVGPTLARLRGQHSLVGQGFFDLFEITRPRNIGSLAQVFDSAGSVLRLHFRAAPRTAFKGQLVPCMGGAVVNLSFGISILDAVRDYALSSADFAATDMTVEMLYLIEAKSAAMEESRKLNLRLRGAMVAAEEQALTDTLTGLANRRALDLRLAGLRRAPGGFALMHLDLDKFKAVNDTLGHAAGDHVLRHVAQVLIEELRSGDMVARIGGDEFLLVLPGLQDRGQLEGIARRIITRLAAPVACRGATCRIGCSIGTVLSGSYATFDPARMIADSDTALYAAKRDGRACHRFFQP
ncbi:MAG: diguanylate cyclase domain-containing protein [Rhodobacterales bacterium]